MIISSWNVNSVRARIENIKEYLKKYSPDILMMQEIKAQDENYPHEDLEKSNYQNYVCLLYTSPSPRDLSTSRMPSSA